MAYETCPPTTKGNVAMLFGTTDSFAIEIGELTTFPGVAGPYVQFRFWLNSIPIGDWSDRIPLGASIENARTVRDTQPLRQSSPAFDGPPVDVFREVYDAFFSWDYTKDPVVSPNLRDRFHLDEIGMAAVRDRYGLVLVAASDGRERVLAKDLIQECFIAAVAVPSDFIESVLSDYIEWGQRQLAVPRE